MALTEGVCGVPKLGVRASRRSQQHAAGGGDALVARVNTQPHLGPDLTEAAAAVGAREFDEGPGDKVRARVLELRPDGHLGSRGHGNDQRRRHEVPLLVNLVEVARADDWRLVTDSVESDHVEARPPGAQRRMMHAAKVPLELHAEPLRTGRVADPQ